MEVLIYVKDGKILKGYEARDAVLEKEADDIINEIGLGEGNSGNIRQSKGIEENDILLKTIIQSFKSGPLSWKPSFETDYNSDFKMDLKRKDNLIEGNVEGKFNCHANLSFGETKLAKARCDSMFEGRINADKILEPLGENDSENKEKQTYLRLDAEFKCRSEGDVHLGTGKYNAKADYEITFETKTNAKLSYHGKKESRTTTGDKSIHEKELGRFVGECNHHSESSGYVKAGILNHEIRGEYDASVHVDMGAKAKCRPIRKINSTNEKRLTVYDANAKGHLTGKLHGHVGLDTMSRKHKANIDIEAKAEGHVEGKLFDAHVYRKQKEVGGQMKVLHGKAKGQADFTFSASVGERKKSLKVKTDAEANISLLDGKGCLGLKKGENGSYSVSGIKYTVGKCKAKASLELERSTPSKTDKIKWKADVSALAVTALSADIRKTEKIESQVKVDLKGVEVNALNAKVSGIRENKSINATVEGRGAQANVGNLAVTGIDKNNSVSVSLKTPGLVANIGNVQLTGLKTGSVDATADTSAGVNAFNASFGLRKDTGASINSQFSYGNINMTLGPPRLDIGCGFNIGVPLFSGGGNGNGNGSPTGNTSSASSPHPPPPASSSSENINNNHTEHSAGIDKSNGNDVPESTGNMNNGSLKTESLPRQNHSYTKGDQRNQHPNDKGQILRGSFTNTDVTQYSMIKGFDRQHGDHHEDFPGSFAYDANKTWNEASSRPYMSRNSKNVNNACKRDITQIEEIQNNYDLEDEHEDVSSIQQVFQNGEVSTNHFDTETDMKSMFGNDIDNSASSDVWNTVDSSYDIDFDTRRNNRIEGHPIVSGGGITDNEDTSDEEGYITKQSSEIEYGIEQDKDRHSTTVYYENASGLGVPNVLTNDIMLTNFHQCGENKTNEITFRDGRGCGDVNLYNESDRARNGYLQNEPDRARNGYLQNEPDRAWNGYLQNEPDGAWNGYSQNEPQSGPRMKTEENETAKGSGGRVDTDEPDITFKTNSKQKTYNSDLLEKIQKKLSRNDDIDDGSIRKRLKHAWNSKLDSMNRDELKKCLGETYKGCDGYPEKPNNGSTGNTNAKTARKPAANKKKPFGEKKNIHTIFTLGENDGKEIRYLKSNVACFGDDD